MLFKVFMDYLIKLAKLSPKFASSFVFLSKFNQGLDYFNNSIFMSAYVYLSTMQ